MYQTGSKGDKHSHIKLPNLLVLRFLLLWSYVLSRDDMGMNED